MPGQPRPRRVKKTRQGQERYSVLNRPSGYPPENAKGKAGANIYRAAATGCRQFVFGWGSNFTIGYLLPQP